MQEIVSRKGVQPSAVRKSSLKGTYIAGRQAGPARSATRTRARAHLFSTKHLEAALLERSTMASGMGPKTCSIIARCSKFSWVWNRASPALTRPRAQRWCCETQLREREAWRASWGKASPGCQHPGALVKEGQCGRGNDTDALLGFDRGTPLPLSNLV